MSNKPEKKLTNIRPREVSFVDSAANEKDFLVVKNKQTNLGILKKLEVAIHSLNFFKSTFPDVQSVKDYLIKQGIDPEVGVYEDKDWEIRYILNDESLFEGTSLAMGSYIPMNKDVDSLIGVVKCLSGEIAVEKKGAKVSSKNLEKIKEAFTSLETLLKELEDAEVSEKKTTTEEVKKDETPVVETPVAETPVVETPVAETPVVETEIEKRFKSLEEKINTKDTEIELLKKKVTDLENLPGNPKGDTVDQTVDVKKNQQSMWAGIL